MNIWFEKVLRFSHTIKNMMMMITLKDMVKLEKFLEL